MNNYQNAIFRQLENFYFSPSELLGIKTKKIQFDKICHSVNHPQPYKDLNRYGK